MAVTGMANLAVKVADLDAACAFYAATGATVRDRMVWNNGERADVFLGPVMITLFTHAIYEDAVALPAEGFLHPALFTDDLDAEIAGHDVVWGPEVVSGTFGTRRIAFVNAPGGIRLEFMEQLELPATDGTVVTGVAGPGTAPTDNPLGERRPIAIANIPWEDFSDPNEPNRPEGPLVRWLVDPASGNRVMHVKSAPGRRAEPHWHLSDTLYIVTDGEFLVEGEPLPYRKGDLRWVRGGFAYGPESSGPDGAEYLFVSLGPYDKIHPDEYDPPLGRWDRPETWVDGYPQVFRRTLLAEDPRRPPDSSQQEPAP